MYLGQCWDYILKVANHRRQNNQTPWHVDENYLEIIGAAGELAARSLLGLPEVLHEHFDGGTDLRWAGYKVDVKTTIITPRVQYRYLQYPAHKQLRADIVLMFGVDLDRKMAFPLGWAWSAELKGAEVNYKRDVPCHEIPIPNLHPVYELHTILCQSQREPRTERQSKQHSGATAHA